MKNSFCFNILKVKSLVSTNGNAEVSWRCQFTGKNLIKNGATKSVYFYNDSKLIILVQPIAHSIYTSKPWQVEEYLIWWFNIFITYLFFGISLHSTVHLFWDSVQMLACCLFAKLEVVPPQQWNTGRENNQEKLLFSQSWAGTKAITELAWGLVKCKITLNILGGKRRIKFWSFTIFKQHSVSYLKSQGQ